MRIEKVTLLILVLIVGFVSCKKDDDAGSTVVEIRDRGEQQIADNDSIIKYLSTHYFNKSDFDGNTNPKIADLRITEITTENISADADSILINQLRDVNTNPDGKLVKYETVFADTNYEYYVLILNEGYSEAPSPTFADNILVTYEGFTLDNEVFDSSILPVEFDLIGDGVNTAGLVPIWRKVLPRFKTAEGFVEQPDGLVEYYNHGTGVMFAPSGLGYFATTSAGIPSYSPLIFKFELFKKYENDHDGDGVPSYMEDIDGDGEFTINYDDLSGDDTDDDTDGDGTPDYIDIDDDGDGIATIYEDIDEDGDPTNDDTNGNTIPNYRDPEDTLSNLDND
ncbi:FKBP-type peptidyl-prolyl cis-trans isomerase [Neotamlana nanhaiensis]|uniref:FKBP-type peptidyl-prolyl cis-trans isomerase n=1 Tax=Neotamlana nanhaiensis TaxID=1382798 RepID=UPI0005CC0EF7|nr:hypothetical protein [Tamlana nanhaiensis]